MNKFNAHTNSMMKQGLVSKHPKKRLVNIHKEIMKLNEKQLKKEDPNGLS